MLQQEKKNFKMIIGGVKKMLRLWNYLSNCSIKFLKAHWVNPLQITKWDAWDATRKKNGKIIIRGVKKCFDYETMYPIAQSSISEHTRWAQC